MVTISQLEVYAYAQPMAHSQSTYPPDVQPDLDHVHAVSSQSRFGGPRKYRRGPVARIRIPTSRTKSAWARLATDPIASVQRSFVCNCAHHYIAHRSRMLA